jgi:thymidine kinase
MSKLYFRYSAMNAGKSTALMQVAHNYQERGMRAIILKPATDTKAHDHISSRIGIEKPVDYLIGESDNLLKTLDLTDVSCVLVDESQFLSSAQVDQLWELAVTHDVPVICYGIRTDFQLEGFPGSTRLLLLAHSVEELKTICRCGSKALYNMRLIDGTPIFDGEQVAIDGEQVTYESVCGRCYVGSRSGLT